MIESAFNRLLRFNSSGPIYRRDDFDSKSRSKFEVRFKFESEFVEFDQKLVKFNRKRRFWFKFDQIPIESIYFDQIIDMRSIEID